MCTPLMHPSITTHAYMHSNIPESSKLRNDGGYPRGAFNIAPRVRTTELLLRRRCKWHARSNLVEACESALNDGGASPMSSTLMATMISRCAGGRTSARRDASHLMRARTSHDSTNRPSCNVHVLRQETAQAQHGPGVPRRGPMSWLAPFF